MGRYGVAPAGLGPRRSPPPGPGGGAATATEAAGGGGVSGNPPRPAMEGPCGDGDGGCLVGELRQRPEAPHARPKEGSVVN